MYLVSNYGFRNQSAFSKRTSDNLIKKELNRFNLKLSSSKTTLQLCPTQRSQSQANQTINNLAISQDLQSPRLSQFHIKAFIRFKPLKILQQQTEKDHTSNKKIAIIDKKKILCQDNFFAYDHIFQSDSQQQQIYNCVCKQMVSHFMRGFNSTVFTYGQTGSGKTYTMFGDFNDDRKKGIIPAAIKDIFASISQISQDAQSGSNNQVIVSCSMLQIYKQVMIDLLTNQKADLKIKQNQFFNVSNLTIKQVNNQLEMYEVLKIGNQSKKMRQTNMNQASSRSHVIFTIYLEVRKQHQKRLSKFNLVDLAGSQKVSKSKVDGQGLQQAKKINLSLSCLGNTINALLKRNDHIPYRQSKLTRLLYESLGGNSLTRLIVTCSSQQSQIQQTLSSLKFASRAKNLKTNPLINTLRKSQKSVSRIAYQNLKTNLNKAEYKIKAIKSYLSELKSNISSCKLLSLSNQIQNKQNININFNKDISAERQWKQSKNSNQELLLSHYQQFALNIQSLLLSSNFHINEALLSNQIKKQNVKQKMYSQTLLNPFILISQSKQKDSKISSINSQQINIKKQSDKKNKKNILLKNSTSREENSGYWSIVKSQQKQIQNLKKKIQILQKQTLSNAKQQIFDNKFNNQLSLYSTQAFSIQQSRKNSHMMDSQCIKNQFLEVLYKNDEQLKDSNKNKRKLNIKLASKALPVRQIFLKSPTNTLTSEKLSLNNGKQKCSKQKSSTFKKCKESTKCKQQRINSPRQFIPTQYKQQASNNQAVQILLKQICNKLEHKNEYQKFQKNILLRQLQLMYEQKVNRKPSQQQQKNSIQQTQTTHATQKHTQNSQINLKQNPDTTQLNKKVTLSQANQLLISQTRYIDQLESLIVTTLKKDLNNIKKDQIKNKITTIKLR